MNPTIKQLEAAIAAANEKLAELKAAEAEKAWPQNGNPTSAAAGLAKTNHYRSKTK